MILPYKANTPVRVTSPYGYRVDPITGAKGAWHGGVDLVSDGDKTVCAVMSGTVLYSRMITDPTNITSEWGNYICILGEDGLLYYYCHLAQRLVSADDYITAGQAIGIEGSTGRSTGSHLHLEIRNQAGAKLNPADIIGVPNVADSTYIINDKEDEIVEDKKKVELTDSEPNDWARKAVEWAIANCIICGDENGNLMLREPCTREQVLVFIYRAIVAVGEA